MKYLVIIFFKGFKSIKVTYSYHSLMVTSAIPSPMSDNLKGRISEFIPFKQNSSSIDQ